VSVVVVVVGSGLYVQLYYYYYYYYAVFNTPCVGHKDDESQASLPVCTLINNEVPSASGALREGRTRSSAECPLNP